MKPFPTESLVGQKHGHLMPTKVFAAASDGTPLIYECTCEKCGKTGVQVKAKDLFYYRVRSCGCTDPFDLRGMKFSRWTVIDEQTKAVSAFKIDGTQKMWRHWLCRCDCGNTTVMSSYSLISRHSTSCGCLKIEKLTKYPDPTDKLINHRLAIIKQRCYNPKDNGYRLYGGRGIYVCKEWMDDSKNFVDWFKSQPNYDLKLEVDRIDCDGPYAPWNCRLATREQQLRNRRCTVTYTVCGREHTSSEWSKLLGLKYRSAFRNLMEYHGPEWINTFVQNKLGAAGA